MLIKCPDRMNSTDYVKILNNFDQNVNFPGLIFQQDTDPVHKAHIVEDYFRRHKRSTLKWPVDSLDLRIIENM